MKTGMILAAGFGTRLRPITHERPKPLVPVGDRSVLAHAADNLRAAGVSRVVINTHHLGEQYDAASLSEALRMEVILNHEVAILGTAGGIAGARRQLGAGPVIVHNGDILADIDMEALVATHESEGALATLALIGGAPPGEGPVGLDRGGVIVRLRDQSIGEEHEGAQFIGVHILSAAIRERLPHEGCMVGDVYIPAMRAGEPLAAAKVVRRFTDVGTPRAYLEANRAWLTQHGHAFYRGPGATIADRVELRDSVIGAGATVRGEGLVERCVIWPGAEAQAPLCDTIVTTGGAVVTTPR